MPYPQTCPHRGYETKHSTLSQAGFHPGSGSLRFDKTATDAPTHNLAASDETTGKPAANPEAVDWEHEFAKSRQRSEQTNAVMKALDDDLQLKIAKLKADAEVRKRAIRSKIAQEDKARLKQLLARLEISSGSDVDNVPASVEPEASKVEPAHATTTISPDDGDLADMANGPCASEMETRPWYEYTSHLAPFHEEPNNAAYPAYWTVDGRDYWNQDRQRGSWDRY